MLRSHRKKIVSAGAALLVVAGGAGAVAATGALSPKEESQAVLNDAAEQLGVEASELSAALKQALSKRVDAAVAAGSLTEAQGDELKARIDADEYPLFGLGHGGRGHGHLGHFADLDAAAAYLGLTEDVLRTALRDGKTLAGVAEDRGKSVDGLVAALVTAATEKLEQAVADGRLTEEQKHSILSTLEDRITDKVNGGFGPGPGGAHGFHGPPPPADSGSGSASSPNSAAA